jgi:hypothetical protein
LHFQADPVERLDAPIALGGVLHEQGRDHRVSLRAGRRRRRLRNVLKYVAGVDYDDGSTHWSARARP